MKLCITCTHFFYDRVEGDVCTRKKKKYQDPDPVRGYKRINVNLPSCSSERKRGLFKCGPSGKYYKENTEQ